MAIIVAVGLLSGGGSNVDLAHWASPSADPVWAPIVLPTPTPSPTPTPVPSVPTPTSAPAPRQDISEVVAAEPPPPQIADERGALAALVHETFPNDSRMSNHVVWAESLSRDDWWDFVYGGRMSATNDCGLMQINWPSHAGKFAAHGWTLQDCFSPVLNLVIAREVYNSSGPWAWTTY